MNDEIYYLLTAAASKFRNEMHARDYYYTEGMMKEAKECEEEALGAAAEMMHAIESISYRPIGDGSDPF